MRVPAALVVALLAGACNKSLLTEEDAQVGDLPPPATVEPAPAPLPSTSSDPVAVTGLRAEAGATAGAEAGAKGAADGGDVAGACGDPPLRDCPLKAWMKANCAGPVTKQDLDALAYAFDKIASFAPADSAGFVNWVSIARDGADAARAASMVGVKGACRGCHQQYKDRYKAMLRARALP